MDPMSKLSIIFLLAFAVNFQIGLSPQTSESK